MVSEQARTPGVVSTFSASTTGLRHYGLLALIVLLLSLIGIYWRPLGQLSAMWPANAVLLGLFLRAPGLASPAGWLAAAAGFVMADLMTDNSWHMAIALSAINLLSVFVASTLCANLSRDELREIRPDSLPRLFLALLAASSFAGTAGGLLLWRLGESAFWEAATDWAVAELLAYIILLPCMLSAPRLQAWRRRERRAGLPPWAAKKLVSGGSLLVALLASVFIGGPGVVAFPVSALLVCALSCGLFLTSLLTLAFSLWTLLGTAFGGIQLLFDIGDVQALLSLRLGVASVALAPIVVASVMASRERSLATMRHLAEHDALTGLLNHRTFHQRAGDQLASLADRDVPAAILMVDIDYFKHINDTYGHAVGDEVLGRVASALRQSLRSHDLCGRLGGEEFGALIPECTPEHLEAITLRIHQAIRRERFELDDSRDACLMVSVSIGATLSRGPSDDLKAMLIRADQAMYEAKQAGRDRSRFA